MVMDGIVTVIFVAVYFLFLITCYFVGERQGEECVQLSLVPELT